MFASGKNYQDRVLSGFHRRPQIYKWEIMCDPPKAKILQHCQAPTEDKDGTTKGEFYSTIALPSNDIKMVKRKG